MRRIDLHCHPNTEPWYECNEPYIEELRRYWRRPWQPQPEEAVVAEIAAQGVEALMVAFDCESVTGRPPCSNDYVTGLRDRFPDTIVGVWGSVDPHKGEHAIADAVRAVKQLGVIGFHFHPICGNFAVDDDALYPLWETIDDLGVPVLIDVGTTGMGAGAPGGLGRRISLSRPLPALDNLAAAFPDLTIIAAHPGWPWVDEMIAVALHKGNVFWELSGWAPKYFPEALRREISGRLRHKIMFGSDYPSLTHARLIDEWQSLGYPDDVLQSVFAGNAERILGLGGAT